MRKDKRRIEELEESIDSLMEQNHHLKCALEASNRWREEEKEKHLLQYNDEKMMHTELLERYAKLLERHIAMMEKYTEGK